MDFYGFYTGAECKAYEYLGAHKQEQGFIFRTFAPAAKKNRSYWRIQPLARNRNEKSA